MPENKEELFSEIFEFNSYLMLMLKHVREYNQKDLTGNDERLLFTYMYTLHATMAAASAITERKEA